MHMDRTLGIGGSDISIIAGISKYRTPYELYLDKIGEGEPQPDNPAMAWGRILEDVIANEFAKRNSLKIKRRNKPKFHKTHKFMMAHVDRLIDDGRILEIKTARFADDNWGKPGTDEIPPQYYLQVQHYLEVFDSHEAILAVLIAGSDYREYTIPRNLDVGQKIITLCSNFWHRVKTKNPPPPSNLSDIQKLYKYDNGNSKIADQEIIDTVSRINEIKSQIDQLKSEEENLKHAIGMFLEDSSYLLNSLGDEILSYKTQTKTTVDSKKLKSENPEIYEKYSKTSESRVMLFKKEKK